MKAVFLDRGSFPESIKIRLSNKVTEFVEYENTQPEEVAERIKDAHIVLSNKILLNEGSLNQATNLQLVQVMATGTNNVDKAACERNNIKVQNVEGYSTITVPEHTFSMLLALRRNLFSYTQDVENGKWASSEHFCFLDYPIQDLSSTTMVIIGGGSLGKRVANIAEAFGMEVIFAERKGAETIRDGYVPFESALPQADVISLHCTLTEETTNLIGKAQFDLMKSNSILLNISRGGIVNEEALLGALQNKQIAGAAFDVATQEPMPLDHPLQKLSQLPNFLLTPHVAWASNEAMQKLVDIATAKITTFIDGLNNK
ncbi:D-2-hydroxyacid dehydrogenase [Marinomonas sp. C2222]|uniref:D-2-hydroxyacid dehydrogenase n=1 Tax=Marinomonas sargassi TaxID=2984494 RepID=A0ABT2YSA5_9GAMM|nr:D-2-hydroxyacid dehydrogenase [Marinomonas sargassi]MCV2402768.1 D-2-hydroxyacid dehydrogenase [Marinomonas sargassi]